MASVGFWTNINLLHMSYITHDYYNSYDNDYNYGYQIFVIIIILLHAVK